MADQGGRGREEAGAVGHHRVPGRGQGCFGKVSQRNGAIVQCQHPVAVDAAVREPFVVQAHEGAPGALQLVVVMSSALSWESRRPRSRLTSTASPSAL